MPNEISFTENAGNLGINQDSLIVIYDNKGIYCAPRVWWMLKSMGHQQVYILNGGLPNWLEQVRPKVLQLISPRKLGDFKAKFNTNHFLSADELIQKLTNIRLLDARSAGRFNGTQAEPRKGLRSGHIQTSLNLPFQTCIEGFVLKSSEELKCIFSEYTQTFADSLN